MSENEVSEAFSSYAQVMGYNYDNYKDIKVVFRSYIGTYISSNDKQSTCNKVANGIGNNEQFRLKDMGSGVVAI
jgi:hypothetical protein